ncbi:MAG: hypothetical protein CMK07_06055 [Ponticaulis sp.]|nr:hypothetical protein [Ponticaulis sp.]
MIRQTFLICPRRERYISPRLNFPGKLGRQFPFCTSQPHQIAGVLLDLFGIGAKSGRPLMDSEQNLGISSPEPDGKPPERTE